MILPIMAAPLVLMGPVELRGGVLVDAPVERVSLQGVEVGGDEARIIGWDNVKRVIGAGETEAAPFLDLAERAWRARIRLARGDFGMASALLEDLFLRLRDEQGPTALMVAEGTLACRLFFGDRVGAVEAWLAAVRLRADGWRIAGDPPLEPIVDPETLLMPGLAPVWLEREELIGLVEGLGLTSAGAPDAESAAGKSDVATRLRILYRASAARALGMDVDEQSVAQAADAGHAGVRLVGAMVQAQSRDAAVREAARASLRDGLDNDLGTWREAWRRAALGRSLLLEADEGLRLDGMFELVHLPARFSRSQADLCGVALAAMCEEAHRRGDALSAGRLRAELESRYPGHPGLRWLDERARAGHGDAGGGGGDGQGGAGQTGIREDTESQESERTE